SGRYEGNGVVGDPAGTGEEVVESWIEAAVAKYADAAAVDAVGDEVRHGPIRTHGVECVTKALDQAVEAHACSEGAGDCYDRRHVEVDVEVPGCQRAYCAGERGVGGQVRLSCALVPPQYAAQYIRVARYREQVTGSSPGESA